MNAPDWRNLAVPRNDLLNIHPLLSVFPHLGFTQWWKDDPVRTSVGRNSLPAQLGELLVFDSRNWCSRWLLSPLFGQEWRCNASSQKEERAKEANADITEWPHPTNNLFPSDAFLGKKTTALLVWVTALEYSVMSKQAHHSLTQKRRMPRAKQWQTRLTPEPRILRYFNASSKLICLESPVLSQQVSSKYPLCRW